MKSLITRFASIGTIFLLVLEGSSATTLSQSVSPQVHIHKGAVSFFFFAFNSTTVLAKVTAKCTGGTGTVDVTITQTPAQSNANTFTTMSGSNTVKCDGQPRAIAVSVPALGANIGEATAMATLTDGSFTQVTATRTIQIRFPVLEGMEQEQGGND